MSKSTKRPIRIQPSRRLQDGKYENLPATVDVIKSEATGLHVHRNDATAKQFKTFVDNLAGKIQTLGYEQRETDDKNHVMFVRQMSATGDEVLDMLEDAPF